MLPPQSAQNDLPAGNGSYGGEPEGGHGGSSSAGGTATIPTNRALVTASNYAASAVSTGWLNNPPPRPEALTSKPDPFSLLRALRRNWLLALLLSGLAGLAGLALGWFLIPVNYTISSAIEVRHRRPTAAMGELRPETPDEAKAFRETQVQMVRSDDVLQKALETNGVADLRWLKRHKSDMVKWLKRNVSVGFTGEGELMFITMSNTDPDQMVTIINAVHQSYMDLHVENIKKEQRGELSKLVAKKEKLLEEMKRNVSSMDKINQDNKTGDERHVAGQQQVLVQQLSGLQFQLTNLNAEIQRTSKDAIAWELQKKKYSDPSKLNRVIERFLEERPEVAMLERELMEMRRAVSQEDRRSTRETPYIGKLKERVSRMEQELEEVKRQLRPKALESIRAETVDTIDSERELAAISLQQARIKQEEIEKEIAEVEEKMKALGKFDTNYAMLKERVDPQRQMLSELTRKISAVELELDMAERIQTAQLARKPGRSYIDFTKYVLTAFSGLGAFGTTLLGLSLAQFYRRKVESAEQIEQGLGLNVLGVLPPASRSMQNLLARKYRHPDALSAVLAESIDRVRLQLLFAENDHPPRVIMVTSAVEQEGKSIVASQLAASLARAGRSVVLVDGDVRRPSVHTIFEVQDGAGFCGVLRGEVNPQQACQPSGTPNLWVLPGGTACRKSVEALGCNGVYEIFETLRSSFDFVVVDSGPVLAQADTLQLGQYVDTAIVAVLRDVSSVTQVYDACDKMRAVRIPIFGVVVNGEVLPDARRGLPLFLEHAA